MNDIGKYLHLFENFEPFAGYVPRGFLVDFLGCLTDASFRTMWGIDPAREGGGHVGTRCPSVANGETLIEAIDWFEAALAARRTYTMITLGACYGVQAVCAYRALQQLNPMPAKLVAVEPDPENFAWTQKHFGDNGIDPRHHWLLNCAVADTYKPVLFPVGSPGSGSNNCHGTNHPSTRQDYARVLADDPNLATRVHDLIVEGDTGIDVDLAPGWNFPARIKFVSAVPLTALLAPFDCVDLLESDIQQSELDVFPPAMDIVKTKVRRVHIGTHGSHAHEEMLELFARSRFEILFSFDGNRDYETEWGNFHTGDGIISARNLNL